MKLSVQGTGCSHTSFPISPVPLWCRVSISTPVFADTQGLCLACRPEFSQAVGFHICSCMESPQSAPGCPLQCPILSSLSQLQAARATSRLPESRSRPQAAFPPAWPRDQPLSIPFVACPFILQKYYKFIFTAYMKWLFIIQRKFSILNLSPFLFYPPA